MKFKLNENGIWDAPNCYECCSDCSACEEDCKCPLELGEDTCDNCIFNKGYKKCSECCTNPRTKDKKHFETGYWHMCDECIKKYILE